MDNVDDALVAEIAMRRWGISPKRRGREWHSPCPRCGGRDRFVIFRDGGYWCRQCGLTGWLDDDQHDTSRPQSSTQWLEHRATRVAEQYDRDATWRAGFAVGYVRGWHDAMQAREREWWHSQGITDYQIDHYLLGYIPDKLIRCGDTLMRIAAYTIPIRDPDDWEIVNVQYRLVDPPPGVGKYRQEPGIPAAAFYAEPRGISDRAIIVEGAKKAMVVYDRLDGALQIIGLPGNTPGERVIDTIRAQQYSRVWIMLDPGCLAQARHIAQQIGGAYVVNLPDKPDDALLNGTMTVARLREYIRQARWAC